MIEESYVSFDTAKMLKEAGFREHCRCMYFPDKDGSHKICQNIIADYNVTDDEKYEAGDYYGYGDCYLAPTQALAARWLREVHDTFVKMERVGCFDGKEFRFYWSYSLIRVSTACLKSISGGRYDSYEEALEVGIAKCLEQIIEEMKE